MRALILTALLTLTACGTDQGSATFAPNQQSLAAALIISLTSSTSETGTH